MKRLPSFRTGSKEKTIDLSAILRRIYRGGFIQFSDCRKWKQVLLILTNEHIVIDSTTVKKKQDLVPSFEYNFFFQKKKKLDTSDTRKISVKSSDVAVLALSEISSIESREMESSEALEEVDPTNDGTVFGIFTTFSKPIFFRAKTRLERNQWMLMIDGMISNHNAYVIPELDRVTNFLNFKNLTFFFFLRMDY